MKLLGNLILRLIMIVLGVGLATLAAGVFLSIGLFGGMIDSFFQDLNISFEGRLEDTFPLVAVAVAIAGVFSSVKIAGIAILPLSLTIAIAELMRWQSMTINLVLGGLVALFAGISVYSATQSGLPSDGTLIVLLATGFVGGFFYWMIAGRSAGKWLDPVPSSGNDVMDRV